MKKLCTLTIAALSFVLSSVSSQAGEYSFADVYTNCGIGAMLFNGSSDTNKTLAIISNVTWDLGTTAHSSNASSAESCKSGQAATAALIMQTYPKIVTDLAKGDGEYLAAMVETMGCSSSQPKLISGIRSDLSAVVNTSSYVELSRKEKSATLYDSLSNRCI